MSAFRHACATITGSTAGSRPPARSAKISATGLSSAGQRSQIAAARRDGDTYFSARCGANRTAHQTSETAAIAFSHDAPSATVARIGTVSGTSHRPYRLGPGVPPLLTLVVCVKLIRNSAATMSTTARPSYTIRFGDGRG